jgi:hypothetical protein
MKRRLAAMLLATTALTGLPAKADAAVGRCQQYEPALAALAPKGGWDVNRMSRLMWRESRCTPDVRSKSRDSGLLQINDVNHKYLTMRLGAPVTSWLLMNPTYNIWSAARLCEYARKAWGNCYAPWAL